MQGMLSSRGKLLLFADADGATNFPDVIKVEEKLRLIRKVCNQLQLNDILPSIHYLSVIVIFIFI